MRTKARPRETLLEWAQRQIRDPDYIPVDPKQNGLKAILSDLGLGHLTPREVEETCKTAKAPSIDGFLRYDVPPCGCWRMYVGLIMGASRDPYNLSIQVGGVEGVKPCEKHRSLIEGIRLT